MGEAKINSLKAKGIGLTELDHVLETMIRALMREFFEAGAASGAKQADIAHGITETIRMIEGTMYPMHRPAMKLAYGRVLKELQLAEAMDQKEKADVAPPVES